MKGLYRILLVLAMTAVASQAAEKIHKIKKGESLYTIAKRHHTTIAALCKANGLSTKTVLQAGKTIKIPSSAQKRQHKKHIAHHSTKRQEKRLARALVRINSKKIARVNIKKAEKFTLNDIVFSKKPYKGKLSPISKRIIELAKQKLGKRYVWGATGQKNTFDCSGLTSYVCKLNGIKIPRRAIQQSKYGIPVKRSELQPGDLIFFDTSKHRKGYVNHVGIYIGNGKFIHASSAKKKVVITSLNKPFYSQRFKGARRVASL